MAHRQEFVKRFNQTLEGWKLSCLIYEKTISIQFQSNLRGMETGSFPGTFLANWRSFNQTLEGWKLLPPSSSISPIAHRFNQTLEGWKPKTPLGYIVKVYMVSIKP